MKINWISTQEKNALAPLALINLEYALELQVIMILIKEAEHLMDYKSLIILDVDAKDSAVTINEETPEPLYSILERNLTNFGERTSSSAVLQERMRKPSFMVID